MAGTRPRHADLSGETSGESAWVAMENDERVGAVARGLLPQSEYEVQHAVPPAVVGHAARVFAKHAAARWHGGRDAYQQQLLKQLKPLTARRIIKDGRHVKR
jgi:hypothetical protein